MDREKPSGPRGTIFLGEFAGPIHKRTRQVEQVFEAADIKVSLERNMDGWLKYHFAFIAPTAGVISGKGGDLRAVAADTGAIHRYCRACREAGDVLRAVGYRQRQPAVFNLYYWLPRWLEPAVFSRLFGSRGADVRFGLHARVVGPALHDMAAEFAALKAQAGIDTPTLDALLECVPRHPWDA
jgi:ketopantoate reductase